MQQCAENVVYQDSKKDVSRIFKVKQNVSLFQGRLAVPPCVDLDNNICFHNRGATERRKDFVIRANLKFLEIKSCLRQVVTS